MKIEDVNCDLKLTASDLEMLANSWIDAELAAKAGIERVDSFEGARRVGREKEGSSGKYSGLWFPYRAPPVEGVCGGRLRRDRADQVMDEGRVKDKAKYLTAPGERSRFYFGPEQKLDELKDISLPIVIFEGEKKTLAGYRLARHASSDKPVLLAIGISGVWNFRGKVGRTVNESGASVDVTGPISDFDQLVLTGRDVYISFDADWVENQRVRSARHALAKELKSRGAKVKYFDVPADAGVKGFDDWVASVGPDEVLKMFHSNAEAPAAMPKRFRIEGNHLIHVAEEGETVKICTAIEVLGRTSSAGSDSWGKLLRWLDDDGQTHTWVMPSELLANHQGIEIRKYLLSHGVTIEPDPRTQKLLSAYLSQRLDCGSRIYTTTRTGWTEDMSQYVLPDTTVGNSQHKTIFHSANGVAAEHPYRQSGSLDEWREHVGRYCSGNSRLVLGVSAAFAGPLLRPLGIEGGGIHYFGPSGSGKSTAQRVAKSVWGTGNSSWNTTRNGLEIMAERYNDSLLVLDEIGEADAREVGEVVYMLANGVGRARMTQSIEARRIIRWKLIFISSGEVTLADHVQTAGKKVTAGQEVRLLNIPAQAHPQYGLFEDVGDGQPAEYAKLLTENANKYYGSASREFIRWLITEGVHAIELARDIMHAFVFEHVREHHSSEVGRAADRFALIAAAGTLATIAGITGWRHDEARNAAATCFNAWLGARGTEGSSDDDRAIRQVVRFLELHGNSRFEILGKEYGEIRVANRAGIRDPEAAVFYISPEVFCTEVCNGFEYLWVARLLRERGFLDTDGDNRLMKKPPSRGTSLPNSRCYAVNCTIFEHDAGKERVA
jgi:uncharacterized protein (DUF927 family)